MRSFTSTVLVALLVLLAVFAPAHVVEGKRKRIKKEVKPRDPELTERNKQAQTKRFDVLKGMAEKYTILPLKQKSFTRFIKQGPRNYTTILLFAARDKTTPCASCPEFIQHFTTVAHMWSDSIGGNWDNSELFFGVVYVEDAREIYAEYRINAVPLLYAIPPTQLQGRDADSLSADRKMNPQGHPSPGEFIRMFNEKTKIDIHEPAQPLWISIGTYALPAVALVLMYIQFPEMLATVFSPAGMRYVAMAMMYVALSGYVWNKTNYTNWSGANGDYIDGGPRRQFVLEGLVMSGMHFVAGAGFVALGSILPYEKDARKLPVIAFFSIALTVWSLRFILKTYAFKSNWYPFGNLLG